ncbi:MAG: methyltransferase [Pseudonocardiaceae bacterium]
MFEELINARKILATIEAADEVGILELVADDMVSVDELSEQLELDRGMLLALLQVLGWNGVLDNHGEKWTLSVEYQRLLGGKLDRGQLPLLRIERWAAHDHLNANGIVAALHGHHRPPEIPERYVAALADAMLVGAHASAPHVARVPELRGRRSLADVAGGSGGYAVWLCRLRADLRATVYDRPEMLVHTRSVIEEAGLAERITSRAWNLRSEPVPAEHDCALLSHVLHLLPRDARGDLLGRLRIALPGDGVLIVHDFVYEDPQPSSRLAASAVDWLSYGTGFVPTNDTITAELREAGFAVDRIVPIAVTDTTLIVARCV